MSEPDDSQTDPFCRHWSHPADCEKVCADCGHGCGAHDEDLGCLHCDCDAWDDEIVMSVKTKDEDHD